MDDLLTERQARILTVVVREHIAHARPVSSLMLAGRGDIGSGAATLRSELARLTEMGFLHQPHTSAGRVPTVEGYRYFVEHLMEASVLNQAERAAIRHQFHRAGRDPDRWMRLSAALMAQSSGAAALVAIPRSSPAPLRRLELIALDSEMVHVVAVMTDGTVRQWRWRPDATVDQLALNRLGDRVNAAAQAGATDFAARADDTALERAGLDLIQELLPDLRQPTEPRLYHAGLAHVLEEPEFAGGGELARLMDIFEYGAGLERFVGLLVAGRVEVVMGGEPPLEEMPGTTFILAPFGAAERPAGVLGVVGSRRLSYERVVPAVRFVSGLLTQLYAGEEV